MHWNFFEKRKTSIERSKKAIELDNNLKDEAKLDEDFDTIKESEEFIKITGIEVNEKLN